MNVGSGWHSSHWLMAGKYVALPSSPCMTLQTNVTGASADRQRSRHLPNTTLPRLTPLKSIHYKPTRFAPTYSTGGTAALPTSSGWEPPLRPFRVSISLLRSTPLAPCGTKPPSPFFIMAPRPTRTRILLIRVPMTISTLGSVSLRFRTRLILRTCRVQSLPIIFAITKKTM